MLSSKPISRVKKGLRGYEKEGEEGSIREELDLRRSLFEVVYTGRRARGELGETLRRAASSIQIAYIETRMKFNGIKFFLTQSPRHFEGGDWNQGGSCRRVQPLGTEEVEDFFNLERNGTNVEVRLVSQHLLKALKGSSFHILDVTHMSEFRADAHPSTAGGKKHEDCMHWCLPGLTDTWIDLLMARLENLEF